jgi:hypothetical protein
MAKPVRSARGETVDFDLLRIKQQIASAPKTTNVKAREDFIDQKFKRRIKKLNRDIAKTVADTAHPVPVEEYDETPDNDPMIDE